MKRFLIVCAAVVLIGIINTSCNNYVCPAYTQELPQQPQPENTNS